MTNGNRTFTGARSFLQSHPSYTWRINTNNITDTNSAVLQIQQSNFRNGTTTYEGAGSGAGTALPSATLSIGGSTVTFTSVGPFWNNETLGQDDIAVQFVRPRAVFSADTSASNQVVNMNYARTGDPTFYYPTFWFTTPQRDLVDLPDIVSDFTSGNTVNDTRTTKTGTPGNLGITYTNNTGVTQYLWVAYPTGITTCLLYTSPSPRDS